MNWEDLKVYHKIPKENLSQAKKEITKIISNNLAPYGFKLYGRKLIRLSEDLFHFVHLDTRGSWMGASESLKTEIAIVAIFDTDIFLKGRELTGKKNIEALIPSLRNYYQITDEYQLFADYISRKLIENILPYFDKFENLKKVLEDENYFLIAPQSKFTESNENLILYGELATKKIAKSPAIINEHIKWSTKIGNVDDVGFLSELKNYIQDDNWLGIEDILNKKRQDVFKKLKIKAL